MLWLGHLAFGYLVSILFINLFGQDFTESQGDIITIIGTISAILPDFDLAYSYYKFKNLRYKKKVSHRNWISHAPIVYLIIGLLFYFALYGSFHSYFGLIFLFGSFSHFVGDSIEYGVMWLYPLSKKKYSLYKAPSDSPLYYSKTYSLKYYWDLVTKVYMKGITFYFEVIVIITALVLLFIR